MTPKVSSSQCSVIAVASLEEEDTTIGNARCFLDRLDILHSTSLIPGGGRRNSMELDERAL
jgi:hypothetical protein